MPQQAKPVSVNKVWASNATLVPIEDAKIAEGWVEDEKPRHEDMNWVLKETDEFCKHINQSGLPMWDAITQYDIGAFVKGANNHIYKANTNNTAKDPLTELVDWTLTQIDIPLISARFILTTDIIGIKTAPAVQQINYNLVTHNNGSAYADGRFTAPFLGLYAVNCSITIQSPNDAAGSVHNLYLYLNGAVVSSRKKSTVSPTKSLTLDLTDYVTLYPDQYLEVFHNSDSVNSVSVLQGTGSIINITLLHRL